MKINPDFLTMVSLQHQWSVEQRHNYFLLEQEQALNYLIRSTGRDYGYSLIKWSIYLLFRKKDTIGVRVIISNLTGENIRRLQHFIDFLESISQIGDIER
jgi:spore cortex formation protein SpoVR/YcgB (stage V sporulation)